MIYFDNAATTFPKPEIVYQKMDSFYRENGVNSGRGAYKKATLANDLIENTRNKLKNIVGFNNNYEVIINSSATESINLILKGYDWSPGDAICYSPFEHNAVLRVLFWLEKNYEIELIQIPFNQNTLELEVNKLNNIINNKRIKMFIVSHVSNVIGNILPLNQIIKIKNKHKAKLLVDGAQAAGLIKPPAQGIDYYIFAGHKTLYGPLGVGGFLINKTADEPSPLLHGGSGSNSEFKGMPNQLPDKFEAGSPNIHAISGLYYALDWIDKIGVDKIYKHKKDLTTKLIKILEQFLNIKLFLPKNLNQHIGIISGNFSSFSPTEIGKTLDENFNISVRTGLHCSPEIHRFLGTYPEGLVRFSLSYFNKEREIIELKDVLNKFLL